MKNTLDRLLAAPKLPESAERPAGRETANPTMPGRTYDRAPEQETFMLVRWTDFDSDRPVALRPSVDLETTDDGYVLYADLPGVEPDALDISVERGVLTLTATRTTRGDNARELNYRRSFRLSDSVDTSTIEARLENGVLALTLPRAEETKARRIEVSAA